MTPRGESIGKPRLYFQYRVTEVGGSMEGRIAVGDLTLDWWHGKSHTYTVMDLRTGDETGWYRVENEGRATPGQQKRLREAGKAVAA